MKRFFLLLATLILGLTISTSSRAAFTSTVSLSPAQENTYTTGIDAFFDRLIPNRSTSFLKTKFVLIHDKIEELFDSNAKLSDTDIFVLEYIDWSVVQWLNDHTTSTTSSNNTTNNSSSSSNTSSSSSSSSNDTTIDTDDYIVGAKTISIAKISKPVLRFKVVAELEDILVDKVAIIADSNDFDEVIEKVYLYDAEGKLIGSDRPTDDEAVFDDAFILKEGSSYLYVALQPFDNNDLNDTFTFTLDIREATGETSDSDIDPIIVENTDDIISIVPVATNKGAIQLLDKYQGYYVDTKMYNQAKTDLAIISFTPESNTDDDIYLRSLEVTLEDNTDADNVASTLRVQRIDTQSAIVPIDNINDNQVSFDLSNFGSKAEVAPDTTVVLLITGTPTLDPTIDENISIELDSNQTTNGIITYTIEDNDDIIETKSVGYVGSVGVND